MMAGYPDGGTREKRGEMDRREVDEVTLSRLVPGTTVEIVTQEGAKEVTYWATILLSTEGYGHDMVGGLSLISTDRSVDINVTPFKITAHDDVEVGQRWHAWRGHKGRETLRVRKIYLYE